jgi:hypothetical protein
MPPSVKAFTRYMIPPLFRILEPTLASERPSLSSMLPSLFHNPERELNLSYLEEWDGLKGCSKERNEQGDLFSPRDCLVDNIIMELFEHFLEWDIDCQPGNPLVFQPMDRDKLHTVSNNLSVKTS